MIECHQLNEMYKELDEKAQAISNSFHCDFNYYNRHYSRGESGDYEIEYFPIPVITIKGICDIEIGLNQISVTTKLSRNGALSYDFEKVKTYSFEAYGVENYLDDFYTAGNTIDVMIDKIMKSEEENIFFSFYFSHEVDSDSICEFVKFLSEDGFFY